MKMTRSTSMTSTRGVTLMSEKAFASSSSLKATCRPALGEVALGQVHELEGEVAHLGAHRAHLPAEVVVRDERGHRGDEAGGGVDEGFRDARRHDPCRALERALDGGEALHEEASGVGWRHFAAVLHLLVQLGVTRAEDADERARLAFVADSENVGEFAALAEVIQERARVGRGA